MIGTAVLWDSCANVLPKASSAIKSVVLPPRHYGVVKLWERNSHTIDGHVYNVSCRIVYDDDPVLELSSPYASRLLLYPDQPHRRDDLYHRYYGGPNILKFSIDDFVATDTGFEIKYHLEDLSHSLMKYLPSRK